MTDQDTVVGTIHFELSPKGQLDALRLGLPAARSQTIQGPLPKSLLDYCSVDEDGAVTLDLTAWPVCTNDAWDPALARAESFALDTLEPDPIQQFAEAADKAAREVETRRAEIDEVVQASFDRDLRKQERAQQYIQDPSAPERPRGESLTLSPFPPDAEPYTYYKSDEVYKVAAERLREDRRRFVRAWLNEHGTANQRARFEAGLLPPHEVTNALADDAFAAVDVPRFVLITTEQAHEELAEMGILVQRRAGVAAFEFVASDAKTASADQWNRLEQIRKALAPGGTVQLRVHECYYKGEDGEKTWVMTTYGVLAKVRVGPFVFAREFEAPGIDDDVPF